MKKGFTLVELLAVLVLIIIVLWLIFIISHKKNTNCYWTTKGIICSFGKVDSNER